MPKSTDVPSELKQFNKIFERLAYRWQYSTVYDDYLSYCVEVFNTDKTGEVMERLKNVYKDYYECFIELFREHLFVTDKMIAGGQAWYDLLGSFYECLSSRSKASALGQFFTPHTVCDFMAQITVDKEMKGKWLRLNDPACGSGRTMLAAAVIIPGNYFYGEDLDPMCAKMCAINMVLHGMVGQVCCMDSLIPERWHFGYNVNARLYSAGEISIQPIDKEKSFSYMSMQRRKAEYLEEKAAQEAQETLARNKFQLNLFDQNL